MPLLNGFLSRCRIYPGNTALVQGDRSLKYEELHRAACGIAANLAQLGVLPPAQIAIALDRGIDAAIAIFGVLYHGCCYIPLDINNPESRLRFIIEDAQAKVIIGRGLCPVWVENKSTWFDLDQMQHIRIDTEIHPPHSIDLGAILYTSGSTGTPKGVALSRRALWAFARWAGNRFHIEQNDQIASLSPFFFDLSVFDLFSALNFGATVNFVPKGLTLSPSRLSTWLKVNRISVWYTVPSLLCFLALKGNLQDTPLPKLRCVLFAGEVFPTRQLMRLLELLPKVQFFNLFGPTETNVCCYWPVDSSKLNPNETIPIGIPACEVQLRLDGEKEELAVKGSTVFSGYWKAGKLDEMVDSEGWYCTGDRVSLNDKNEFLYHGRVDRMLKCAGYRIEPAEVERVINSIPGVVQSAVIGIKDPTAGVRLVAAIASSSNQQSARMNLEIRGKLPRYMWPSRVVIVGQLPTLSNGKVDYPKIEDLFEVNPETQS